MRRILEFMRDKLVFHYEWQSEIEAAIEDIIDSVPSYDMWLSKTNSANDVWAGTTDMSWSLILGKMQELGFEGDIESLVGQLIDVLMKTTGLFRDFISEYFADMFSHGEVLGKEEQQIEVKFISEVDLPFYCLPDPDDSGRSDDNVMAKTQGT